MDHFFENFHNYEGFGPGILAQEVPETVIRKYQGRLPNKLLEYWQKFGWRGWAQGLFWTVNPAAWEGAVHAWLANTPFAHRDTYHLIARSAFGKLLLWGETSGPSLTIQTVNSTFFFSDLSKDLERRGFDRQLQLFFSSQSRDAQDLQDDHGVLLFNRSLERLGATNHETMYGFVPALAFGGACRIENIQVVDALTHLTILAQIDKKRIMQDIVTLARR